MSAAQRRRQRRLRSMLRHEQQSIRMALATVMHHSYKVHTEYGALRGLKTATRAGKEGREEHDALRRQRPPPLQPELFQLYEAGWPVWSRRGGLRRRFSGTPWSNSLTSFPWCRSWTLLGCWVRLGWWTSFGSSTRRRWTSWSSPCPSFISPGFLDDARVVDRGEQNSWWRCRN